MSEATTSNEPYRQTAAKNGSEVLRYGYLVLLMAFAVRFIAVVLTSLFGINPESEHDAVVFASTADAIAAGVFQGQFLLPGPSSVHNLWGLFLAPYWLLPGPSLFYARVGNAVLGAFAIYNVYIIARYYHSHHAGVFATLPMIFYPSFVAVHSTVLREAIVLFGITTAVRLVIVPSQKRSRVFTYAVAIALLALAYIHRPDNAIIYWVGFGAGITAYAIEANYISKRHLLAPLAVSPLALYFIIPYIRRGVAFLARIRDLRASGRTMYLADVVPQTIPEFLAFSFIGAAYFLYAPFPWMIETAADLLVSFEGLVSLVFTIASIWGIRSLIHRNAPAAVGLLGGFAVAVVLYGVGTVNFGTGMRHRQMFLWVLFLFGGIGLAQQIRIKWPFETDDAVLADSNGSSKQTQQALDD
jgi:hypothetical protein